MPKTQENKYHADMIDGMTVDWIGHLTSQLYDFDSGDYAYPTSIVAVIEKLKKELVTWAEKTMKAYKIPITDKARILSIDTKYREYDEPSQLKYNNNGTLSMYSYCDMVVSWQPNGLIRFWDPYYGSTDCPELTLEGTPYKLTEADFVKETVEPEPETIEESIAEVKTEVKPKKAKKVAKKAEPEVDFDVQRVCRESINSLPHHIQTSSFCSSYNGACTLKLYSPQEMFVMNKYINDKFTGEKLDCSLRRLTTFKKKVAKLKTDIANLDQHFARYNDFANLIASYCFGSTEYTMKFADEFADLFISIHKEVESRSNKQTNMWNAAYDLRRELNCQREDTLMNHIKEAAYTAICRYNHNTDITSLSLETISEMISDTIGDSYLTDVNYNTGGLILFESQYYRNKDNVLTISHDNAFLQHICMMYPEMFGYKGSSEIITPVEKFFKELTALYETFRSLFFEYTFAQDTSKKCLKDVTRWDNYLKNHHPDWTPTSLDDKMWDIKVPSADFLNIVKTEAAKGFGKWDKHFIEKNLVTTISIPESYCYLNNDSMGYIRDTSSTRVMYNPWSDLQDKLADIVTIALLNKLGKTSVPFTAETVNNVIAKYTRGLFGKAIAPVDENYDTVKTGLTTAINDLYEHVETLEKGLLMSECVDFIEWGIKDQFISKDLGEARLAELKSVNEEVVEVSTAS